MPRARIRSTSRSSDSSTERWKTPGIEPISRSIRAAVHHEERLDQVGGVQAVFPDEAAEGVSPTPAAGS